MMWRRLFGLLVVVALLPAVPSMAAGSERLLPAFPGAEGFGAYTSGGRGGEVLFVTTLEDYDRDEAPIPGSLRAAVEHDGARVVIFRVGGTIQLKRDLRISNPYITIAGNTAPGDGVQIRDYTVFISTHDVVIRHLRSRLGDTTCHENDSFWIRGGRNVILDHCSATWSIDENLSVTVDARDITIQNCIIAEALHESHHEKGNHGYGSIAAAYTSGLTFHHNLYAHNRNRNPRAGGYHGQPGPILDFRNNVIYNWRDNPGYSGSEPLRTNWVNNFIAPGPDTNNRERIFQIGDASLNRMYASGNHLEGHPEGTAENWRVIRLHSGAERESISHVGLPFSAPTVSGGSAEQTYERVLENVGATLPVRDPVDTRIIQTVRDRSGTLIDTQEDVGGWPELRGGEAPVDTSGDGMPDEWKLKHGLDPEKSEAHEDLSGDGYTNIEAYIHGFDPTVPQAWVSPPRIVPGGGAAAVRGSVLMPGQTINVTVEPSVDAPEAPIHYTLDGTEPTEDSPRYDGAIEISGAAHLRARVVMPEVTTHSAYASFVVMALFEPAEVSTGELVNGLAYRYFESDRAGEGGRAFNQWPESLRLSVVDQRPEVASTGTAEAFDLGVRERDERFAMAFAGYLRVPEDGVYTFTMDPDEDLRNRVIVHGYFVNNGRNDEPGQIALKAGLHPIEVWSVHHDEPRSVAVMWEGPGVERQAIPASALFRPADPQNVESLWAEGDTLPLFLR
jgi:hypothetical protein